MRPKSFPTDQLPCSNGRSSSFIVIATRRTNGESNIPINNIDAARILVRWEIEEIVDDCRGDHCIRGQKDEEETATGSALLYFELRAQQWVGRDVCIDPVLRFPATEGVRSAQRLDGIDDPALAEQRGRLRRQWFEAIRGIGPHDDTDSQPERRVHHVSPSRR